MRSLQYPCYARYISNVSSLATAILVASRNHQFAVKYIALSNSRGNSNFIEYITMNVDCGH